MKDKKVKKGENKRDKIENYIEIRPKLTG